MIKGAAERYVVRIWNHEEIPEDLKQRFLTFLRSLRVGPIEVKSVRIEKSDEFPA
jgi:hypothetical protein